MADLYVDAQAGSDSNSGLSSGSPKRSLSTVQTFLTANATGSKVYLSGHFRGQVLNISSVTDCWIEQWAGMPQAIIDGSINLPQYGWTNSSGSEWYIDIPSAVGGGVHVYEDWETNVDSAGNHRGHLSGYGIISGVGSLNVNEYNFNSGTGRLTIRTATSENPNTNGRLYSYSSNVGTLNGKFQTITTLTVRGLIMQRWGTRDDTFATAGFGVACNGVTSCTVDQCQFHDLGNFVVGALGLTACGTIVIRDCVFRGIGRASSSIMVGTTSLSDDFPPTSISVEDCAFHVHAWLDRDGVNITGDSVGNSRQLWGINAGGVSDLEVNRCTFLGVGNDYSFPSVMRTTASHTASSPSAGNEETWSAYPVRMSDCTASGMTGLVTAASAVNWDVALRRCSFIGDQLGSQNEGAYPLVGGQVSTGHSHAITASRKFLLESCVIAIDSGVFAGGTRVAHLTVSTSKLIAINSIIHDDSSTVDSAKDVITFAHASGIVKARQTLFSTRSANTLMTLTGGTLATGNLVISDCWYYGYTVFSDNASWDTLAEWTASIDAAAVSTNPGYTSPPLDMEGSVGSNLRSTTKTVAAAPTLGVNGLPYSSYYGPYQYVAVSLLSGVPLHLVAGESITPGQVVYRDASDGRRAWRASNGTTLTAEVEGVALTSAARDQPVSVLDRGQLSYGGLTAGVLYVVGPPGALLSATTVASGDYVSKVGIARTSSILEVHRHPSRVRRT